MSRGDLRMSAFPSPTITALLAPGAREVLAGLRVDPDHVALVEVLHRVLLERPALGLVLGAEAVLGLRPAAQVAELGLHHAAPVAGRHVDDVHHAPEVALVLDDHTHAELRGGDKHRDGSSWGSRQTKVSL